MIPSLFHMDENTIRGICRDKIESLEFWLRRLIDNTLTERFGNYFSYVDEAGNRLIKSNIIKAIEERRGAEPSRYPRLIDAILLEDAISIVCNQNLYKHFKDCFQEAFPQGSEVLRLYLDRIAEPRNRLSHANPISVRQAEQVICYSNDVIESIKSYYKEKGMEKNYNVPEILKVVDSFGSVLYRNQIQQKVGGGGIIITLEDNADKLLYPGDTLSIELEVDPSFPLETYRVEWWHPNDGESIKSQSKIVIPIKNHHVGERFSVSAKVVSNKDWHKHVQFDDSLLANYKVLPPR